MPTYKNSVGLQYSDFSDNVYKKLDLEVGLPIISKDAGSFLKIDGFIT